MGELFLECQLNRLGRKHGEDVAVASQKKNECVVMFER